MTVELPRFVIAKPLAGGATGFYFNVPTIYRRQGCTVPNEPLGPDYATACGADGRGGRAAALNGLFDEWKAKRDGQPTPGVARFGTVAWLFREYFASENCRERVSRRSRPDYERVAALVIDLPTKRGDTIGARPIASISPRAADLIYERLCAGPHGPRLRQAEKVVTLCKTAWRVVRRLHPDLFDAETPNPWEGVTKKRRAKAIKPAATREQVYRFALGAIERGQPEAAAAAAICFEFLQRPENVLAGYLTWPHYRGGAAPNMIRILHHKTGATVLHPLQEAGPAGAGPVLFYPDAENILAKLPRRGVAMILQKPGRDGIARPFSRALMSRIVRQLRTELGLPATFTLDACRHGGMTELEEAELTTGQGRALSGHRSTRAYAGYAKLTLDRALAATRKRHAHRLASANVAGTNIQNDTRNDIQNDGGEDDAASA